MSVSKNRQISALNELGQSVWYDNLSRDVLRSGELQSLIEQGVSGLTSNPTIFKQAIADTSNYDEDMKSQQLKDLSTEALCEELMIRDVAAAADLLRPTYDATAAGDGYASIEVSPNLAADAQGTVAAAQRIWKKLNRPNVMIKIPATPECIPAIQQTLESGINVNVTLIFSQHVYEQVAEAYIAALEARVKRGEDVRSISSVASFFVSRVDAIVEKHFDALVQGGTAQASERSRFLGKVGVANSKLAYESFEKLFGSPRFKMLQDGHGARVQRPLWASTGTKNPAFKAVMYVEELAGRATVNTMPPATVKALLSGGDIKPLLHTGLDAAKELLAWVNSLGLSVESLLKELQVAGVKSFAESYRELLASIDQKRAKV
jgi:transaldolase